MTRREYLEKEVKRLEMELGKARGKTKELLAKEYEARIVEIIDEVFDTTDMKEKEKWDIRTKSCVEHKQTAHQKFGGLCFIRIKSCL